MNTPNFAKLGSIPRGFSATQERLPGHRPTIAITPVADGRTGAYENNQAATWRLVRRVYDLLDRNVRLSDGQPPRIVVAPEIVYGARTGALAQSYYTKEGVSSNLWISRSWAYSDELMSACSGIGSSEWQQAAYGLNQTDRPGAVWLKAFCAAMDEKKRPIFSIYNPDLESEDGDFAPYIAERMLRFARCATAVAGMRGKNYLSVGGVSMGIIGSDVRRNTLLHYFGIGAVSVDMIEVKARMDAGFFDHEELARAIAWLKRKFRFDFGKGARPFPPDALIASCVKMTIIVRDLMIGNSILADPRAGKRMGFKADVERAQGHHAIAAGTQGQRAWTDHHPNYDLTEAILCGSFDWNGFREPFVVATENDCKNAMGMLAAELLTGLPQLFADIRTNWTPESAKAATGVDIRENAPRGFIDKRNSGAGALDFATDIYALAGMEKNTSIYAVSEKLRKTKSIQAALAKAACSGTTWSAAVLEYFPGDGLSSHFRTPGRIPMTAYRYNVIGDEITCSIVEGETVELPTNVADYINAKTDPTWPETYWAPRGMSSFEYMRRIGPNHDANAFGLIGADLLTLNAMLRIPVDFHNILDADIFRPTFWDRCGADDFRACEKLGSLYQ
ncbi:MAG: L-fucose isomerase [Planctomycetota bacterium]